MKVSATNSLGWEIQSRRIDSKEEWSPSITEVTEYTDDDVAIESPVEPFKTYDEANEYMKYMHEEFHMDPAFEFRVYEVVREKK